MGVCSVGVRWEGTQRPLPSSKKELSRRLPGARVGRWQHVWKEELLVMCPRRNRSKQLHSWHQELRQLLGNERLWGVKGESVIHCATKKPVVQWASGDLCAEQSNTRATDRGPRELRPRVRSELDACERDSWMLRGAALLWACTEVRKAPSGAGNRAPSRDHSRRQAQRQSSRPEWGCAFCSRVCTPWKVVFCSLTFFPEPERRSSGGSVARKMKWAVADMGSFGRFGFAPHERKLGSARDIERLQVTSELTSGSLSEGEAETVCRAQQRV